MAATRIASSGVDCTRSALGIAAFDRATSSSGASGALGSSMLGSSMLSRG